MEVKKKQFEQGKNKSNEIMTLLQDGKIDEVNMKLGKWFNEGRYNYIYSVIEGCDKTINYELLELVTIYTKNMIEHFKDEDIKIPLEIIRRFLDKVRGDYNNISDLELKELWNETNLIIIKKLLNSIIRVAYNHEEYREILSLLDGLEYDISSNNNLKTDIKNISLNSDEYYTLWVSNYEDIQRIDNNLFDEDNIDYWFSIYDFDLIAYALLHSGKREDINMFHYISTKAQERIKDTRTGKYKNKELVELIENSGSFPPGLNNLSCEELKELFDDKVRNNCVFILMNILLIAGKRINKFPEYKIMINEIKALNIHELNLFVCGNIDYKSYLNNPDERIRKVASILNDFNNDWKTIPDDVKERIKWIETALNLGAIDIYSRCEYGNQIRVQLSSSIFSKEDYIGSFDEDIIFPIRDDRRILASKINDLIDKGIIILKDEYKPNCFKNIKTYYKK